MSDRRWALRPALIAMVSILATAGLGPHPIAAQSVDRGAIRVSVLDPSGSPVGGTLVTVFQGDAEVAFDTTEREGQVVLSGLSPGTVRLSVESLGYRPAVVLEVQVVGGGTTHVAVTLQPGRPPFERADTLRGPPPLPRFSSAGRAVGSEEIRRLPALAPELARLSWTFPRIDDGFGIEGLPGGFTRTLVNGIPMGASGVSHGDLRTRTRVPRFALGQISIAPAEARASESGGAGGSVSESLGWPGSPFRASAEWMPAQAIEGTVEGPDLSNGFGINAAAAGAASPSVRVGGALELFRADLPTASILGEGAAAVLPPSLRGFDFGALGSPQVRTIEDLKGAGQLEWQGDGRRVHVFGGVSNQSDPGSGPRFARGAYGWLTPVDRTAVWSGATFHREVSERTSFDVRVGFDRDEATELSTLDSAVPLARIVSTGEEFGSGSRVPALTATRGIFVSPRLFTTTSNDRSFEVGALVESRSHTFEPETPSFALYSFPTPEALIAGEGSVVSNGPAETVEFDLNRVGGFLTAFFDVGTRGRAQLSARAEYLSNPLTDLSVDTTFARKTGLEPGEATSILSSGVRMLVDWTLDEAATAGAFASIGVGNGPLTPGPIAEALVGAGGYTARVANGTAATWPISGPSGESGTAYSVLGADYRAPRTIRASGGVRKRVGSLQASLSAIWRRTDFLVRRRDLNLLSTDGVVSRRLPEYERIWSLDPDGWSEYRGVQLGLEYDIPGRTRLYAAYALSETVDNWVGASNTEPELRFAGERGVEWDEAVSDFDVPHRLVAGVHLAVPSLPALTLSGLYRFQSEAPFTPLTRAVVDTDGDGSAVNNTALIAGSTGALQSDWSCLGSVGLAARNGCRGAGLHRLDASVAYTLVGRGTIHADFLGLVASETGPRDAALYISSDPTGGDLSVNPSFGEILFPLTAPRILRLRFSFEL